MQTIKAYYDGRSFVPEKPLEITKNRTMLISINEYVAEATEQEVPKKRYGITLKEKRKRDAADLKYLNDNAEQLNAEAADVLLYQADIFSDDSYSGEI